ncbi:hypothetical protein CAEBREN_07876 [Caenorhabditis brenneri]|uniref:Uncharacterized protein n=1 Tax=Caenorhabditis brenneri TaxID=135651 RepID=G0P791_CAEBE|nr:hypothetical protein CAEBREN_07876 [Caenorhabditis brenneri]
MTEKRGLVLAVDDTTVTLYALGLGVQVRDLVEDDIPELGSFCTVLDDDYVLSPPQNISHFEPFNKDGVCHIQLLVSTPNLYSLPELMREKFEGAVWSPFVQYLNDPNGILDGVMGGEVTEVIAKYAPFENKLFEVVSLVEWKDEPLEETRLSVYQNTPWLMEWRAREMKPCHEVVPDVYGCVNPMRIYTHDQAVGVCIVYKAPNPTFFTLKQGVKASQGSEKFVSWLWSPMFGLTRWLIREDVKRQGADSSYDCQQFKTTGTYDDGDGNRLSTLGKWFVYGLNDTRWREQKKAKQIGKEYNPTRTTMDAATVSNIKSAGAEKPFRVVPKEPSQQITQYDTHELQMEVSFPFHRNEIEDDKGSVRKDAHFYDLQLGKVEIYPTQGRLILKKFDEHLKELQENNADGYEKGKDEVFIVVATVTVIKNWYENARNYPRNGLFLVKWIDEIKYLHGGRSIYRKE